MPKRGTLNWVSHQQTYILFTSFTQGCHCGKVLDDSFCVDSLASAGFSARGRGKKTKALLKQLQLILLNPVQPAPPSEAVLRLSDSGICSLLLSHFRGNTSIGLNEEVQSYDSSNRFFIQLSSEVLHKPTLHCFYTGAWSLITNIQTSSLGYTYIQLTSYTKQSKAEAICQHYPRAHATL